MKRHRRFHAPARFSCRRRRRGTRDTFRRAETSDQTDLQRTGQGVPCRAVRCPTGHVSPAARGCPARQHAAGLPVPLASAVRLPACIAVTATAVCSAYARARPPACAAAYELGRWIRCERIPTLGFWLISTITILIRIGSLSIDHIEAQWVYHVRRSICNRWQNWREQGLKGKLSRPGLINRGSDFFSLPSLHT